MICSQLLVAQNVLGVRICKNLSKRKIHTLTFGNHKGLYYCFQNMSLHPDRYHWNPAVAILVIPVN